MPRGTPTDQQVAAVVRHLTRLHLEVERGLRPPEHLDPMMSDHAYRILRTRNRTHFPNQGPVDPTRDLGHVRISRYPDGRIFASIATREEGDHWGAVTMQLHPTVRGQLQITELSRLRRGEMAHQRRPTDLSLGLVGQIRRAEDERRAVEAACLAEQRRPGTGGPDDQAQADGRMIQPLTRRLHELDAELQALLKRLEVHKALSEHDAADRDPPNYITRVIGDPPYDEHRRRLWTTACTEIENYREAWGIADDLAALGPNPTRGTQQHHRERVMELIRTISPQLARETSTTQRLERALDRTT